MEMGHQASPVTGTVDELNQEQEAITLPIPVNVPVSVDGPIQVHLVPSVASGSRAYTLTTSDLPLRIGNEDPRRRSLTVVSLDTDFYVGETQNEVASRYSARWPRGVPLVVSHKNAVYVLAALTTVSEIEVSTTTLSALTETWAN